MCGRKNNNGTTCQYSRLSTSILNSRTLYNTRIKMTQLTFDSCSPPTSRRPRYRSREDMFKPVFCDDWRDKDINVDIPCTLQARFCDDWRGNDHEAWVTGPECPLRTTQTIRLCHCALPNPHICNTATLPKSDSEVRQETPAWPGQRPRYKRKRVQLQPKIAAEPLPKASPEPDSWLPRMLETSPSSLDFFDLCSDAEEYPSLNDHKRRCSQERYCSSTKPENQSEPRIDPNWLLFEDLLEEWTSSESSASTPSEYRGGSSTTTSPETVETDEKDENAIALASRNIAELWTYV